MDKMRFSRTITLVGLTGLLLAGLSAPTSYAVEDASFPVFPTVIEDGSIAAPILPAPLIEAQKPEMERSNVDKESRVVTNKSGVFSPWKFIKAQFGKTVFGEESGVIFTSESLSSKPDRQGDLRYFVSYKNNTSETLRGVSIQVSLPKDLQYLDSDVRPDSKTNGVIVFDINKVAAGEEGVIQLETRLKGQKEIKTVVVPATMGYEDIDGGKHTVTAATSNSFNGKSGGLTASAIDGIGGFIMWLIVIILLVALAFVGYKYITLRASGRHS